MMITAPNGDATPSKCVQWSTRVLLFTSGSNVPFTKGYDGCPVYRADRANPAMSSFLLVSAVVEGAELSTISTAPVGMMRGDDGYEGRLALEDRCKLGAQFDAACRNGYELPDTTIVTFCGPHINDLKATRTLHGLAWAVFPDVFSALTWAGISADVAFDVPLADALPIALDGAALQITEALHKVAVSLIVAGPLKLQLQLGWVLLLTPQLVRDLETAGNDATDDDARASALEAACQSLGNLVTTSIFSTQVVGGSFVLRALKNSFKAAHAPACGDDGDANLKQLAADVQRDYKSAIEHEYFDRGITVVEEDGILTRSKEIVAAYDKLGLADLDENEITTALMELDGVDEVHEVLETCIDGLRSANAAVDAAPVGQRQTRGLQTTVNRREKAMDDLVDAANSCLFDLKDAIPDDLEKRTGGRTHRSLIEATGRVWFPLLHSGYLRAGAVQFFKLNRMTSKAVDDKGKGHYSDFVLHRGGTTTAAFKHLAGGPKKVIEKHGQTRLRQPHKKRVIDYLDADYSLLYKDPVTASLVDNVRGQTNFLLEVFNDPSPETTYNKNCAELSEHVNAAARSARGAAASSQFR